MITYIILFFIIVCNTYMLYLIIEELSDIDFNSKDLWDKLNDDLF